MSDEPEEPDAGGAHKQILRATTISGAAALVNIVVSIARAKALAVFVGPAGLGLMGLFQRVMTLAIALSSLGLPQSAGKHIAAASSDPVELAHMRRALFLASAALGTVGLILVWSLREAIAVAIFGHVRFATQVGLAGLGVLATSITTSQAGLLQGLRKVEHLARLSVTTAILGGLLSVGIVWKFGEDGIIWMMLATPVAGALIGWRFVARLPRPARSVVTQLSHLVVRWRALLTTGVALFLAALVPTLVQLEVRKAVVVELGLEEAGHFEAAWQVSMLYIGFVLAAMGTDYLPRLTTLIHDPVARQRLVNDQTEIALTLAAPVIVGLAGLAPLVVRALYSSDFLITADLLRLHAVGDIAKIVAWPLAYALIARGANRLFLIGELLWCVVYLPLVLLLLPSIGLIGTAVGYVAAFVVYVAYLMITAQRTMAMVLSPLVMRRVVSLLVVVVGLGVAGFANATLGLVLGLVATGLTAWLSLNALALMVGPNSRIARFLRRVGIGRIAGAK